MNDPALPNGLDRWHPFRLLGPKTGRKKNFSAENPA